MATASDSAVDSAFNSTQRFGMRFKRWSLGGFLVAALILLNGCSSFNRDWNKAAAGPAPSGSMSGAWDGSWLSDHNGHTGRLRCLFTENPDGTYQARFRAVYAKIIHVGYTATFRMEPASNGETQFKGGANLGWWRGGVYDYAGHIRSTNFFATYTNKYDYGTFQMHRAYEDK